MADIPLGKVGKQTEGLKQTASQAREAQLLSPDDSETNSFELFSGHRRGTQSTEESRPGFEAAK